MRLLKRTDPARKVELSIVLLDWSVRESLHVLDALDEQTAARERYELIWVEFYDRLAEDLSARLDDGRPAPDTVAALDVPADRCYHKHLLLNAGLLLARGSLVCFCDSDALARPTFVQTVIEHFRDRPETVLHLDEVRNNDPSFYPFDAPAVDDITGFGCINWIDGRPAGLLDRHDPLHTRNYGACMAARREDLLAIGGADMHGDYLGHICGFYEMTWRLGHLGRPEVWSDREWLYHVWHPGQAGDRNIAGPHDGLHVSTRALAARREGRLTPYREHPVLADIRSGRAEPDDPALLERLTAEADLDAWRFDRLDVRDAHYALGAGQATLAEHGRDSDESNPRPPIPFGRRPGLAVKADALPLLVRLIWRQLAVKRRAARWSRPHAEGGRWRNFLRRLRALRSFLLRIAAFDRHWLRQCWLALSYAAQQGHRELLVYGQDEPLEMIRLLARHLPVRIAGVCPFDPDTCPAGPLQRPTLVLENLAGDDRPVVLASFIDVSTHLDDLAAAGIPRRRIITLR